MNWSNHKNVLNEIAPCTVLHLQFGQLAKPHADVMIDESAKSYQARQSKKVALV